MEDPERPGRGFEDYQAFAERVGMVPSVNPRDNLYQAVAVALGTVLGTLVGFLWVGRIEGGFVGGFVGLASSAFLSGFVLMVVGLVRARSRRG